MMSDGTYRRWTHWIWICVIRDQNHVRLKRRLRWWRLKSRTCWYRRRRTRCKKRSRWGKNSCQKESNILFSLNSIEKQKLSIEKLLHFLCVDFNYVFVFFLLFFGLSKIPSLFLPLTYWVKRYDSFNSKAKQTNQKRQNTKERRNTTKTAAKKQPTISKGEKVVMMWNTKTDNRNDWPSCKRIQKKKIEFVQLQHQLKSTTASKCLEMIQHTQWTVDVNW